jgi:hypothetical protein
MKERDQRIARPTRKPYFVADLGEGYGKLTFRVPSPGKGQQVVKEYSELDQTNISQIEAASGEIIRVCWADEVWELEGEDGRGVYNELWEQGWDYSLILGLTVGLINKMTEAFTSEGEVEKKVLFFDKTPSRSTLSDLALHTSTTRGDSTP